MLWKHSLRQIIIGGVNFKGYRNVGGPAEVIKFAEAIAYGSTMNRIQRMQIKAQGGFLTIEDAHLVNRLLIMPSKET